MRAWTYKLILLLVDRPRTVGLQALSSRINEFK